MAAPRHLIKAVFTHTGILILILVAAFLSLAFHPGSLVDIMRLGYVLYIVHLAAGAHHFKYLTGGHLVMFAVILIILLLNLTVPLAQIHMSSLSSLVSIPGLVLVCHLLGCSPTDQFEGQLKVVGLGTLVIAVAGQLTIFNLSSGTDGAYENIHHLGLFASVCIPVAGFFTIIYKKSGRWIAAIAGGVALYLLWESSSRVSWLAFFLSAVITIIATPGKKNRVYIVLAIAGTALIAAAISGFENIGLRLDELLNGWRSEERMYIWRDAAGLMKQNNIADWIRGRGIGSFRYFIKDYAGLSIEKLEVQPTFPHNMAIQVLFECGIAGLILIFGALGMLVRQLWLGIRRPSRDSIRRVYLACFFIFWILFFHTLLTKSIYSKYITFLFSMVAGITFALDRLEGQTKSLAQMFPGLFSGHRKI